MFEETFLFYFFVLWWIYLRVLLFNFTVKFIWCFRIFFWNLNINFYFYVHEMKCEDGRNKFVNRILPIQRILEIKSIYEKRTFHVKSLWYLSELSKEEVYLYVDNINRYKINCKLFLVVFVFIKYIVQNLSYFIFAKFTYLVTKLSF